MKNSVTIIILIIFTMSLFSQGPATSSNADLAYYRSLNDQESRLLEFKDSDEALSLKLVQLTLINKSRKRFGAEPVKLDILASRVANRMSRESAENGYVSHWNLAGEKPYHRYAFAGGVDHVSENAFGEWSSRDYDISNSLIGDKMQTGHEGFMKEKAPRDGHKKNIIDKAHNYVGIGFYITSNHFSYYEEFVNRGLEFTNIPVSLKVNEAGSITVGTKAKTFLYYMIIYREDFPQPRKAAQLKNTGGYEDFTNEPYLKLPAWELEKYCRDFVCTIPVKFTREGLYYILIYTDTKKNTGQSALSTKGKAPMSGIVISVRN